MSSKPKAPKPKPINQARIQQVRNELAQQNTALEQQLASYSATQMSNLDSLYAQKRQALTNAQNDARANLSLLQRNRESLLAIARRQLETQRNISATGVATAELSTNKARRIATIANNKQKPQVDQTNIG